MTDNHLSIPSVQSGSYPLRPGNVVSPLVDGIPAFRRICEAIEAAKSRVWGTVTFMWSTFEMPDGRGTALDVLDRAAARGVDVRLLFWRPDGETEHWKRNAFWGSDDHICQLESRRSGVQIRWDRAYSGFCQHQKSWLMDEGSENEIAFVGGINLNPNSVVSPGHPSPQGEAQNHDVYLEIAGPSTIDVHHNFVQRWNEASERLAVGGQWGRGCERDLPFPTHTPLPQGNVRVQIQRTIHAGCYGNGQATPGGTPFDIASGEQSLFDQYCVAIDSAQRSLYIENQFITVFEILDRLHRALQRGLEVVVLMPAEPDGHFRSVAQEQPAFFNAWAALGEYENFTLAGIASLSSDGHRKPIYVHSKIMLVDDVFATVGSCNLHQFSLFGNGEMNAAFWSSDTVPAFRCELFQEHLDQDTSLMDDRSALRYFRRVALENRKHFNAGNPTWQGLAFALDPTRYGL